VRVLGSLLTAPSLRQLVFSVNLWYPPSEFSSFDGDTLVHFLPCRWFLPAHSPPFIPQGSMDPFLGFHRHCATPSVSRFAKCFEHCQLIGGVGFLLTVPTLFLLGAWSAGFGPRPFFPRFWHLANTEVLGLRWFYVFPHCRSRFSIFLVSLRAFRVLLNR